MGSKTFGDIGTVVEGADAGKEPVIDLDADGYWAGGVGGIEYPTANLIAKNIFDIAVIIRVVSAQDHSNLATVPNLIEKELGLQGRAWLPLIDWGLSYVTK